MPQLKDRLSLRVVTLTIILATMTVAAVIVGIGSLQQFKEQYQEVKDKYFDTLLKMTELKVLSNDALRSSSEMFIAMNEKELQWDLLNISNNQLQIDQLLSELPEKTVRYEELQMLNFRFHVQTALISEAMVEKFEASALFFARYEQVEKYKQLQILEQHRGLSIAIDRAITLFNPLVDKNLAQHKHADLTHLNTYIISLKDELSGEQFQQLYDLFIDQTSLSSAYKKYIIQVDELDRLKKENEQLNYLVISVISESVLRIQKEFVTSLHLMEKGVDNRKMHLYMLLASCILIALTLVTLQINLLRRVHLIRKVMDAGYNKSGNKIPIAGKDEISEMAIAVKEYIDKLLTKEEEASISNKQLQHLASHDDLTNIYNRRYFDAFFDQEHARYLRYKEPYCIAILDLDLFKGINDTYGHDIGDHVLVDFAQRVTQQVRKTDVFARIGGEEFVLLMPRTTEIHCLMLMERIKESVNARASIIGKVSINYTVSIGLVEVQQIENMQEATQQFKFADEALYEAKRTGRNKICVYQRE